MDAAQPARMDEIKERQIRGHVEGEAMIAHPAPHRDADGGDLLARDPDAGAPRDGLPRKPPLPKGLDQTLLDVAQEPVEVPTAGGNVANDIPDELPRPVPGEVTAAGDLEHLDAQPP